MAMTQTCWPLHPPESSHPTDTPAIGLKDVDAWASLGASPTRPTEAVSTAAAPIACPRLSIRRPRVDSFSCTALLIPSGSGTAFKTEKILLRMIGPLSLRLSCWSSP